MLSASPSTFGPQASLVAGIAVRMRAVWMSACACSGECSRSPRLTSVRQTGTAMTPVNGARMSLLIENCVPASR